MTDSSRMTDMAKDISAILNGDTSSVPPSIRLSVALKLLDVDHHLGLAPGNPGGILHVAGRSHHVFREALSAIDLPAGHPSTFERGYVAYEVDDDRLAAWATAAENGLKEGARG